MLTEQVDEERFHSSSSGEGGGRIVIALNVEVNAC